MPDKETIKVPLWDGADSAKLVGQRIFESVAEEIALKGVESDDFSDSSLDGDLWSAKTAGNGTVVETTQLDCDGAAHTDVSALVYKKNPSNFRSRAGDFKTRFCYNTFPSDGFLFSTTQKSTEPSPGTWDSANVGKLGPHIYYRNSDGKLVFRYYNSSEQLVYLDNHPISAATTYTLIFEVRYLHNPGAWAWRFILKNTDESSTLKTCVWILWSNCYDYNDPHWIYLGDLFSDFNWVDLSFYYANYLSEYPTDSPTPGGQWESLPASSIVDMSTIRIPELMNTSDAGSIKYKYAVNGGALSDTWLTQAQLRAEADVKITDSAQSIKIVPQYISNGTQKATSQAYALVDVQFAAFFQLPLEVHELEPMEVIEL
jgi:hypothetical protein